MSLSFLPVDSAKACVHSGKEAADTLLAVKMSVSTAEGGSGGLRERNLLCDHGSVFRQDAPGGKAPFAHWK